MARPGAFAVTTLWALGMALAAWSGEWHTLSASRLDRATLPYEWHGVALEAALISIESVALFVLLFKVKSWGPLRRTAAAAVLFAALVAFGFLTMATTDLPGWCYANPCWTAFVLLMLAVSLATQLAAAAITRLRQRRA